jgi:protein TonB
MLKNIIAVGAGSAVTFGLLFLMQALIASGHDAITDTTRSRIVDFVRVAKEERLDRKKSKPERPSNPDAAPPDIPQPSADRSVDSGGMTAGSINVAPVPTAGIQMEIGSGFGITSGSIDGDYLPIVKVAPVYPRRAIERGIEGYVIVEFTVTKTGAIKNPRIVEANPPTIFNNAALAAALKFKYKPRIVNGEPIEVEGVLNKITFVLED